MPKSTLHGLLRDKENLHVLHGLRKRGKFASWLAALFWVFNLKNYQVICMLIILVTLMQPKAGHITFDIAQRSLKQQKVTDFFKTFNDQYNCYLFQHMNTYYISIYSCTTSNMVQDYDSEGLCYMGAALYFQKSISYNHFWYMPHT